MAREGARLRHAPKDGGSMMVAVRLWTLAAVGAAALAAHAPAAGAAWTGYNDGQGNIGAGPSPLVSLAPSATWNVVLGGSMLPYNTTGSYNVASGNHALWSNTTGNRNVATGTNALEDNVDGIDNV